MDLRLYRPRCRRGRNDDVQRDKLGLWDATAMGIGGMIGGGIFSVLGVAVTLAGNLAFACFLLGAVLAAGTAWSYAAASRRTRTSLGPFDELRTSGHAELSGWLLWLLVFGYVVAMAVYSFTFGRYAASALGWDRTGARALSIAVVAVFLLVNLRGIRVSSLTEDLVVATKLVILAGIASVGVFSFDAARITPLADRGISGLFLGAATVFFAYEGFELIAYDRNDTVDPERTLPRALLLSVAVVAFVYVAVTLGAQMLVSQHAIVAGKEVAFAVVGKAALGDPGRWAAIVGAVIATASAINATLFSTARLIRDASSNGELPRRLGREHHGLPVAALVFISVSGAALAMLPVITDVIALGSGAFLAVYTLVNLRQAQAAKTRWERWIGGACAAGAAAAIVVLVVDLARHDVAGFTALVSFAVLLAAAPHVARAAAHARRVT
jgi:amino acid transporter